MICRLFYRLVPLVETGYLFLDGSEPTPKSIVTVSAPLSKGSSEIADLLSGFKSGAADSTGLTNDCLISFKDRNFLFAKSSHIFKVELKAYGFLVDKRKS